MRTALFNVAAGLALVTACGRTPRQAGTSVANSIASADAAEAVVTASSGKVELLRGASGAWSAAKVGDHLAATDALRTELGEADVALDGIRMRLHESSRIEVRKVEKRSLRTRVHGSVESEVEPLRKLDVEIGDGEAIAHSEGGHFFVTADGKGVIAVASVTGTVHLASKGKAVEVAKGEVSRIDGDAAPGPPSAALRRVLLSVKWPDARATSQPSLPIAGRVEPGSRVFVQGQPVLVEPGGVFRADVPLKQGKQKIAVVTVDALGRRKQVESVVKRDDSLPAVKVKKKLWQ